MKDLAGEGMISFKIESPMRTLLTAAIFCWLLASGGCGGVTTGGGNNTAPAAQRVDWGMSLGAGGTGGLGMFPAKFEFDTNAPVTAANCTTDFVVYNNDQFFTNGSPGPDIIAFNQLYSTQSGAVGLCGNSGPTVNWAYYTETNEGGGISNTSPVLSLDGTKVAFVSSYGASTLHILHWKAGEGTVVSPVTPDHDFNGGQSWSSCPNDGSSCMISIAFGNGSTSTNSPPFYDYAHDVLYVGDDAGALHKFTGVFNGTPAEVCPSGCNILSTSSWPIRVNNAEPRMTGPVYDSVSGNIYIADASGLLSYIRDVGSTVGACPGSTVVPPCLGATTIQVGAGGAIVDAPIVDGTNQMVYAVNGTDTTNFGTIVQASTNFTTSVVLEKIGGSAVGAQPLYGGDFDNTFYGGSFAGHMYVCGKDPSSTAGITPDSPALYQLSFNGSGVLTGVGTPLTGLTTTTGEACSPVTDFFNTSTSIDWIFFSIGNLAKNGNPIPAASNCRSGNDATNGNKGCILSLNLTALGSSTLSTATLSAGVPLPANNAGASSGIVVDNSTIPGTNQTSNIYFSLGANSSGTGAGLPTCNGATGVGCAIKLTQAALQ